MADVEELQRQLAEARACLMEVINLLTPDYCTDGWGIFAEIPDWQIKKWSAAAGLKRTSQ